MADTDHWQAPYATGPVDADVRVPGSKSITNRALILAALADGPSIVRRPLVARDTLLMANALRALGTGIDGTPEAAGPGAGDDDWRVTPGRLVGPTEVDCGLAGTVMRFVPPVATLAAGDVAFDGDPYARKRPMSTLVDALAALGAAIVRDAGDATGSLPDALPFTVRGHGGLRGGDVELDASASSQFVSALLLAGARFERGVTVHNVGKPVPSLPHIEMTMAMLAERGVEVDSSEPNTWRVAPGPIRAVDTDVEPDLSNAAPFLAAALVTGGRVRVLGWPEHTTQPGDALRSILAAFGARVRLDSEGLTVRGPGVGQLEGVDLDLHEVGELTPVIAALAALAEAPSFLRGIGHLRGHETDRLAALATELSTLGAEVTQTDDGLEIRPGPLAQPSSAVFGCYDDHRMAQAGAVLGLAVRGLVVQDIGTTSKTLADFPGLWKGLLA